MRRAGRIVRMNVEQTLHCLTTQETNILRWKDYEMKYEQDRI